MTRRTPIGDLLVAERCERGISPAWRSRGLLSGRFTRVLPDGKGTVEVRFVTDHESGLRWIWYLTGQACVDHDFDGKGRAASAYACMRSAEIFVLEHYPAGPTGPAEAP